MDQTTGLVLSQPWSGSEDMLELLMSDFNTYWPATLLVMQPTSQCLGDASLSSTSQGATGSGHQAASDEQTHSGYDSEPNCGD
jgi:hypothetical protein